MTSFIFRILLACPPCEVGHGRVAEVEDFGIALALGTGDATQYLFRSTGFYARLAMVGH